MDGTQRATAARRIAFFHLCQGGSENPTRTDNSGEVFTNHSHAENPAVHLAQTEPTPSTDGHTTASDE